MEKKRTIIYVRHGHDQRKDFKFDENLTSLGKAKAKKLAKRLIRKYGLPTVIMYSPFLRCRQTLHEVKKVVQSYKKKDADFKLETIVEPKLGKYFTPSEKEQMNGDHHLDVRESTLKLGALIDKSKKHFNERVVEQYENVSTEMENPVIWNICHAIVLKRVAKMTKNRMIGTSKKKVNYLAYTVIRI